MHSTKLTEEEIKRQYALLRDFHKKFLKKFGVKLPKLQDAKGGFTKDALVLIYLSLGYPKTKPVSKTELTHFVRGLYPDTPDVQQARHLGAQSGWWIVAGGRDNIVASLRRGWYQLYTLEKPYPSFTLGHCIMETADWSLLKKQYGFRCATCGSEEDKPHLQWPATKTKLQKAHMNPRKPLIAGNIIPQCGKCNRADRNYWVYDAKGRVVNIADPKIILRCDFDVQKAMYQILYNRFDGKHASRVPRPHFHGHFS